MSFSRQAVRWILVAALIGIATTPSGAAPIGTAFTYQGSLQDAGVDATGPYDFRFGLFGQVSGGLQVSPTVILNDISVSGGIFSVDLDFGEDTEAAAEERWLQIEVRAGASSGAYTALPRQRLAPAPFSLGLSLPVHQAFDSDVSPLLQYVNTGEGTTAIFDATGTAGNAGVLGRNSSTGFGANGVLGEATANSGQIVGVEGRAVSSPLGTGLVGRGQATGAYIEGTGENSVGLYAIGFQKGLQAENWGVGPAAVLVGQGQTKANATLQVTNNESTHGMCAHFNNNSDYATVHFENDGTGQILWLEHNGTGDYIVATNGSDWKFRVDNNGMTHVKALNILGGADLSEKFEVEHEDAPLAPGTVVCIDPAHEGRLAASRQPYDHRVAGIVSGAGGVRPGMTMGQEGSIADGSVPVALTGRVYCRVSAVNGPIEPGDLLTTSPVAGCAMRVSDPARAQGAVLGKAMGALRDGEGLVLVLVGLQ